MSRNSINLLTSLLLAAALCLGQVTYSTAENDDAGQTRQQLKEVTSKIKKLQKRIKGFKQEKNSLRTELSKTEKAIGKVQRSVSQTRRQLQNKQRELTDLKQQRRELLVKRKAQQQEISRQMQTAYQMGRQSQVKVLLNQEQPHTLARAMAYHQYITEARNQRIDEYVELVTQIDEIEPQIVATTQALSDAKQSLDTQLAELNSQNRQRKSTLAKLNAAITSDDQKLKQLDKNRKELERLLTTLEEAVANLDIPTADFQDFANTKGKLSWPVDGKLGNRFGNLRNGGPLRWQGVMIRANEGTPVRAIHHGRVVYADWFRGSGLLLIIDHGDGFMSLYAHNQSLHREVGEWVTTNDIISTVGNSGGQNRAALYFEIRQQGKPTNPTTWCKS